MKSEDEQVHALMQVQPRAQFPVHLAVAQLRSSVNSSGYINGRKMILYDVVPLGGVETKGAFARLAELPGVTRVSQLNRLMIGDGLNAERPLREAAASMHADVLLTYSFSTDEIVSETGLPLTAVTLGAAPNQHVRVQTTAVALLVDVRTGYAFGSCEGRGEKEVLASAWTSSQAKHHAGLEVQKRAFEDMIAEFENLWKDVIVKECEKPETVARGEGDPT